ncbi:glycoside hydrolase family 13 protein [Xylocopilactobacillus apis]|uniref:Oligo-1,6-glucosidase n=1 Tax=Xylocopilactobacillus apis TaxID=2932183 RepID=A0AAU9D8F1_9LACO|nr:alpha-glucosidase [Xylocopilactobacillus apis]BDR57062.1 oligo-1,6-glucosidase [Xylocopilactobacillus apis]
MNDWKKRGIIYEIYPQSFKDTNGDGIGDLKGIIEKLPYIKKLGANIVWLTPIYQSPLIDNGYDISDYTKINPIYGTMDDFNRLIELCHEKEIKLVMDLVVNHTSDQAKWFQESKKSRNNKYSDYYIWRDPKSDGSAPSNLGSAFGGSAWEYVKERGQYYLHLFAKKQPDLNWESTEMRQSLYDMMKFWLDKGVDGFRLDSISLISKPNVFDDVPIEDNKNYGAYYYGSSNGTSLHEYLQEMNREVFSKYDVITIGETPHTTPKQAQKYINLEKPELDMVLQFEHMHVDYGEYGRYSDLRFKLSDLRNSLVKWQNSLTWNTNYLGNHDQPRLVSRFGDDDKYRIESAKMLAMITMLQKGTPMIFQGDEIGMTNVAFESLNQFKDIEAYNTYEFLVKKGLNKDIALKIVKNKSRDNSRTPMQWNNEKNAGFSTANPWIKINNNYDKINVNETLRDEDSIYSFYQKLIKIRTKLKVAIDGDFNLISADDSSVFAYTRILKDRQMLVIGSFSNKKVKFEIPNNIRNKESKRILSNYDDSPQNLSDIIYLRPYEGIVFDNG